MRISDWSSDVCSSDLSSSGAACSSCRSAKAMPVANMRGGAQTRRNEAEAHEWRPERAAQYSRAAQVADAARRSGFRMLAQEREQIDRARKRPAQMIDGADHVAGNILGVAARIIEAGVVRERIRSEEHTSEL